MHPVEPGQPVERLSDGPPPGPLERFTLDDRWDYTVAELLGIAPEHGVPGPGRMSHGELVAALRERGVPLPRKRLERRVPLRRGPGSPGEGEAAGGSVMGA